MFESIREFVRASTGPEETAVARRHHAESVRKWLQYAKEKGQSFNTGYIEQRAAEYENFRAAFEWGLDHDSELSLDIANSLAYYWFSREMGREGIEWLSTSIAAVPDRPGELLAMSYRALSTMHICISEYEPALQALFMGINLLPDDTDPTQRARFLNSMGNALMRMGRFGEALEHFQKGIACCDVAGDKVIRNTIQGNCGFVLYFAGQLDEAEKLISATVNELENGDNNDWLANFVHNSGLVAKVRGDYPLAEARFTRARALIDGSELDPAARSWLNDAAVVALRQGKLDEALSYIRRSAAGVSKSKGLEQQAECLEAAAEYSEAVGNLEEAVALLAVILRLGTPPQRSLADQSPTTEARFEGLRKKLSPERFKSASSRYKGFSLRDVLEEVEDLAKPI
jgi:tetratricopeptide (TPR) repeat protein